MQVSNLHPEAGRLLAKCRASRASPYSQRFKNQTVIPIEVCERLKLQAGDILRYRETADSLLLDKATKARDEPFATFSEWASEADEKAYGGL
jgi:antitoxin PrlF